MVNEGNGILLCMLLVYLQRPDTRGVVDGGVLKALYFLALAVSQVQEFDIDLYMMPRHLLLVPGGLNRSFPGIRRQPVESVALVDALKKNQ